MTLPVWRLTIYIITLHDNLLSTTVKHATSRWNRAAERIMDLRSRFLNLCKWNFFQFVSPGDMLVNSVSNGGNVDESAFCFRICSGWILIYKSFLTLICTKPIANGRIWNFPSHKAKTCDIECLPLIDKGVTCLAGRMCDTAFSSNATQITNCPDHFVKDLFQDHSSFWCAPSTEMSVSLNVHDNVIV